MDFPFYIAKRYLFSKKSHNIINIISGISVLGTAVGTMALVIVLSVFNGFEDLVTSLLNSFNSDFSITVVEGKTFDSKEFPSEAVKKIPDIAYYTEVIEESALIKYQSKQYIATIKGVSSDYKKMSGLDTMIIDGEFVLENGKQNFAVLGSGVAYYLGANIKDYYNPISVYVPKRSKTFSYNPTEAFNSKAIFPSGVFAIQQEFDIKYAIVPLRFARELLDYKDDVTSIEIGLNQNSDKDKIQKNIQNIIGSNYSVKNRFQQQEFIYKIMKSEKWAIFLILTFILLIAIFNVIGSLTMLILDKRKDISVLWSMGANDKLIKRIFLNEGIMISLTGALGGLILGGIICWIQQTFGIITISSADSFVFESYPVKMQILDFLFIFLTVFFIGFIASWFPVRQISRKYIVPERKS